MQTSSFVGECSGTPIRYECGIGEWCEADGWCNPLALRSNEAAPNFEKLTTEKARAWKDGL
ncbi:MAG TPA: hypothetical protein H9823_01155 [Candidatus Rubneribacter avistercoris]|nr:hypothetical protein [Candidatus Rubneribacter avistercoris]